VYNAKSYFGMTDQRKSKRHILLEKADGFCDTIFATKQLHNKNIFIKNIIKPSAPNLFYEIIYNILSL
jgi:hypothetical protein